MLAPQGHKQKLVSTRRLQKPKSISEGMGTKS